MILFSLDLMEPPFTLSREAAEYLRKRLHTGRNGLEAALILITRAEIRDANDKLLDQYQQDHYTVGYYTEGDRPIESFCTLLGHRVSILPSTLDTLRGKVLALSRTTAKFEGPEQAREILVVSTDAGHAEV